MHNTENRSGKQAHLRWDKLRRRLGWFTLAALLIAAAAGFILIRFAPLPTASAMEPTQILDANGNTIASLQGGVNRRFVKVSDISPWLVKATLAVEDRRFYEHAGVDWRGLVRAAWVDMRHLSKQQGASTLTQQLARNLYLTHERTWTRKLKEAWYAARLEQTCSKDQILELYLNQIYYGHGAYGAEAASLLYFNKPAKQLSVAESALLAGIPKGPSYYSPHLHPDQALNRQRQVVRALLETRQISQQQAANAVGKPLHIRPLPQEPDRPAPYFTDYVKKAALQLLGNDERLLHGLTIHTTLDLRTQKLAEAAVKRGLAGANAELQTALISLDPRTGHIKAMVGGRSYRQNQFNRVFANTRQPGSSFKPILYAAALEQHTVTPATKFRSEPTLFYFDNNRQFYRPSNYNDRYFNEDIGLRKAIASSDNIYAVNTIMQVGPEEVISMARKLGVRSPLKAVPSLALGTFPVSPFEMASAFAVFANEGRKTAPIAITRIEDRNGKIVYSSNPREEQVVSPALAYVTTHLLESVFDKGGTAHRVSYLLKRPVAGKTGTTQSDGWFVGYTPELTTAVWIGYDRGRAISSSEAHRAAPIFAEFTEAALEGTPPHEFSLAEGVVNVYIDPSTNMLAAPKCPNPLLETFLAGTEPTLICRVHGEASEDEQDSSSRDRSWWNKLRHWWGV